jgi:serine/threonine-protein kinase
MSLDDSSLDHGLADSPEDDESLDVEVARVLESYLVAVEAGRPADPRRLMDDHPHLAGRLRACLRVLRVAEQAAKSVTGVPEVARRHSQRPGSTVPYGSGTPQNSLSTLDFGPGDPPQVLLREPAEAGDAEPVLRPCSTAIGGNCGSVGRYQLQGEIARGGMGAIIKGRDVDLGRELAIKVLLDSHRGDADVVRRFVEEAQIGGQLQHPGVVPVYELGAFPDRRPFFAMKLVKGRTLSALLAERALTHGSPPRQSEDSSADADSPRPTGERVPGGRVRGPALNPGIPAESVCAASDSVTPLESRLQAVPGPAKAGTPTHADLPRFLSIFEQVCQTMAYAHARGVIHRDLKPSNIMVGSFGEVQVMDWGLAKVLASGGVADEDREQPTRHTVIMTVRSGSSGSGSESQAGSVLGTPSYMAPEQARGEIERVDERSDVFGLGAILCEILTGQPPFVGESREETRAQAARGDLADARGRLQVCGVDAELIDLARNCLKPERIRRPRNAGEVARQISRYLAGVQERLRAAELARVDAQARAEEETKRRALADELVREAEAHANEARDKAALERSRRRLTMALAAAVLVVAGLLGGGSAYLARQRTARLAATARVVTGALTEAERLRGQAQEAGDDSPAKWFEAVAAATRARELLSQGEADHALRQRVTEVLTGLLREQAAAEKQAAEVERDREFLAELEAIRGSRSEHWDAKQTDTEYATAFCAFGIDMDRLDAGKAGKQIAGRSAPVELASYLDDWAVQRRKSRDKREEASWRRLLAAARAADPDPWRVTLRDQIGRNDLDAMRLLASNEKDLADQSPSSLLLMAAGLADRGDRELAERVLQRAWRIKPDDFWVNFALASAHWTDDSFDKPEEAVRYLSAAVLIRPRSFVARNFLGNALLDNGKPDEAADEYREAIRLKPDYAIAYSNLGNALRDQGKLDGAIENYETAIRLKPDYADAYNNLGNALDDQGKLDRAVEQYNKAFRLNPRHPGAYLNLGTTLENQGRLDEAIEQYRKAIALKLNPAEAHTNLCRALAMQGKLDQAIDEGKKALLLEPNDALTHYNLGIVLNAQGKLEEAKAEYGNALRLKPDYAEAYCNLGLILQRQGLFHLALDELVRGNALGSKRWNWRYPSADWVRTARLLADLERRLPLILAGKDGPASGDELAALPDMCYTKQHFAISARYWQQAILAQATLADDMGAANRYNAACAATLAGCGQGKDYPPLDEPTKARWRKQAIDWLKADLAAWSKILKEGPPQARQSIPATLQHWKADPDLAGLRDPNALKQLAEAEQSACRALWAEVDALLANAQGDKKR